MGEELVQFVGEGFFLSMFSIIQWLGAHYACFGQDRGDIFWASLLEEEHGEATVESPPSSGIAQCVPLCFRGWTDEVSSVSP